MIQKKKIIAEAMNEQPEEEIKAPLKEGKNDDKADKRRESGHDRKKKMQETRKAKKKAFAESYSQGT